MSNWQNTFTKNQVGAYAGVEFTKLASGAAQPIASGVPGLYADSNGVLQVVDSAGNVSPIAGEEQLNVTAGATVAAGDWLYVDAANDVKLAKADASSTANVVGVAPAAIASGATGNIQTSGIFTTTGLTAGSYYYLSAATAGSITATAPTATGSFVVPVGYALSTTQLLILPAPPAVQVGPTAVIGASFDVNAAGALPIGPTTATSITLSQTTNISAGKNLTMLAGAGAVDLSAATGTFKGPTGVFTFGGGVILKNVSYTSTGSPHAGTAADNEVFVDSTGGVTTYTLPAPATVTAGWRVTVTDIGNSANAITVARNASEKINFVAGNYTLSQGTSKTFVTNGTDWFLR